eukprot:TRINITY_DN5046_c0_g1_i5.p1 TRINITY_DN5046_c0_g1~~TRINITY_DN5046_c0_g1_i5.p1  ORF type:complete len:112 (+),score=12.71 TRINITY_DN5046_c0_g1_i5:63-398(+)
MVKFFFFKQKTAYEIMPSLVGSEMCIRDSYICEDQSSRRRRAFLVSFAKHKQQCTALSKLIELVVHKIQMFLVESFLKTNAAGLVLKQRLIFLLLLASFRIPDLGDDLTNE